MNDGVSWAEMGPAVWQYPALAYHRIVWRVGGEMAMRGNITDVQTDQSRKMTAQPQDSDFTQLYNFLYRR